MNRILFFLVIGAGLAAGESTCLVPKNPPKDWKSYDAAIDEAFRDTSGDRITDLVNLEQSYLCMVNYIIMQQPVPQQKELFRQSFIDLQAALKQVQKNTPSTSSNSQAGSTSGTGGTTSLISQGKTAQLLSVATEYGALTETQSNQTVTVQGTLDGPLAAVTRQYIVGYCTTPGNNIDPYCLSPKLHNILRDVSYGVTFNTASPNQTVSGMSPPGNHDSQHDVQRSIQRTRLIHCIRTPNLRSHRKRCVVGRGAGTFRRLPKTTGPRRLRTSLAASI